MRGGILIIGSLLWDNDKRETWRRSYLRLVAKEYVKAPIRYGRRSKDRGKTFTMTFGLSDEPGEGVLVPCAAPIDDVAGLVAQAAALWKAEKPSAAAGSIGASWGCVGALLRAERVSSHWLKAWADYFRARASPISPVDEHGLLAIPWPHTRGGAAVDIDVILATATRADAARPSADEVADAWIDHGHERYFFENVRHGIRTSQDSLIWRRIEERAPPWLNDDAYADVVALLRGERAQQA